MINPRVYEGPQTTLQAYPQRIVVRGVDKDGWLDVSYERSEDSSIHFGIHWKAKWGQIPRKGDVLLALTKDGTSGFGTAYHNRGLARTDGTLLYFKTPAMIEADIKRAQKREEKRQQESFDKHRQSYLDRIAALRYHDSREFFRRGIETKGFEQWGKEPMGIGYELLVWEQAEDLADHVLKVEKVKTPEKVDGWFNHFKDASYDSQKRIWPGMDDGHSGNSFAFTVRRAWHLARQEVA